MASQPQAARRWHAAALALYAALSLVFVDHGVSITRNLAGQGSDPFDSCWFLAWWPHAFLHHLDPFFTTLIWQPLGVSLLWVTSVPALAVLMMPLTLLAGPVLSYNLLILAAPVLSAWFAYLLCWRLTRRPAAALIGGFLFGFSAFEMGQDTGALNLSMTFCLPALLLVVFARLDDELSRPQAVTLAALLLLLQFLIAIEIFAFIFVFGGIAWLLALRYLPARRTALGRLLPDALYTAPLVFLPLLPLLVSMSRHAGLIHHPEAWPYFFTTDLLNLFIPSANNLFGAPFSAISRQFHGGIQEEGAYLGLPLLFILWRYARGEGRGLQGRLPLAMFLICLLASFGPRLWVAGVYTPLVLPWALAVHLPLLSAALPVRFMLFASLAAAIMACRWLAAPGRPRARLATGLLACLVIAPAPHPWQPLPLTPFFAPGRVQAVLGPYPRLLILPFSRHGPSSFWQQENGFGFAQTGGYLGFPPAPMQQYQAVGDLFGGIIEPGFPAQFTRFCQATRTQYVIAGPGTQPALLGALQSLGWPERQDDGVAIFQVPGG